MRDVMVDIETWGGSPAGLIVSIGAVQFSTVDEEVLGEQFYVNIDPVDAQREGMEIDARTVDWWLQQSQLSRKALLENRIPLRAALTRFADFLPAKARVWARGANFDLVILRQGYKLLGYECPWHYRGERCTRVFLDIVDRMGLSMPRDKHTGVKHNALDDAIRQVGSLVKGWQLLQAKLWRGDNDD